MFAQSGKALSSIYEEQRNEEGGSNLGGPLRYPHIIMFWLQCDQVRIIYIYRSYNRCLSTKKYRAFLIKLYIYIENSLDVNALTTNKCAFCNSPKNTNYFEDSVYFVCFLLTVQKTILRS